MRSSVSHAVLALLAATLLTAAASADVNAGDVVKASTLSGSSTTLNGGTVQLDTSRTYSNDFSFKDGSSSTLDIYGSTWVQSGKLTGAGAITITNSVGGGLLTLTNSANDYTGITTINSGATLALFDSDTSSDTNATSGTIAHSKLLVNNGTFDISGAVSSTTLISLSGSASSSIKLGAQSLILNDYDSTNTTTYDTNTTYAGVISGTGSLTLSSGEITLTGVNTLTGAVYVASDKLHLSGAGSISQASAVVVYGTLDLTAGTAGSATIKSLTGSGTVLLGASDLVLTAASGSFAGTITGTGGVHLLSGTQYLGGADTFTGGVTIASGATLQVGSTTVGYSSILNNGTFSFYSANAITLNSNIAGSGAVTKYGTAIADITTAQSYTGATTIYGGTIKLSGTGSIAASSGVEVDGIFDLSESTTAAVKSISGFGTVRLGTQSLTITAGNSAVDFSGAITGTGTLAITGGTQSLSGASTYTGTTTVSGGGKLVLVAGASLASAVVDNATVDLSSGITTTGSATIGSLRGSGTVNLGGNTLVLSSAANAAADIFSGTINGTGGLWLASGTETLSGANTYTGTTTVSAGTLILTGSLASTSKLSISGTLDATGATGSALTFVSLAGVGTVNLGGHALVLNAASGATTVFSGAITGTAGLTVSGSGTQILSGANTYTGGTAISSGATLQLGNGSSTGSVLGDIVDDGTLRFYRMDSSKFTGVISGTGAVVQGGIGTTILTGVNTYSGGTTISAGTLQIGDWSASVVGSGATGSIVGNVVDNGTLAFARSGAVTINGVISGSGNLSVLSGQVTLTQASSYTGVTNIASGATLALSNTASIISSDHVTINGAFDLTGQAAGTSLKSLAGASTGSVVLGNQNLTLTGAGTTFAGTISGPGGLILTTGTQVLSGTSLGFTGATTVNGGTLSVTGSIANSAVTVNPTGTLTGTGTVGALTVVSGGTVRSTLGSTLTSNGTISLASGSKYTVAVTSTHSSAALLSTSGTALVGGAVVSVASTDGTFDLGNKIKILSATAPITGAFTLSSTTLGVTTTTFTGSAVGGNNAAVFKSTLDTATPGAVYLTINLSQLTPALATAATVNQKHVVGGIDAAIAAGKTLPAAFEALGNDTTSQLSTASDQLTGELGADTPHVARSLFSPFLDALSVRTSMLRPLAKGAAPPLETWITGYTGSDIVTGDATGDGSHKFHATVKGVVAGVQWSPYRNVLIGGAIAGGTSDFRLTGDLGKGDATSLQAGLYGLLQLSRHFYNSFAAGVAVTSIKTTRVLTVSSTTTPDTLTGKLTAFTFGGRYEAGVKMAWFTPYIGVQDQISTMPGYTEGKSSGADSFALTYASRTANAGRVEVGLRHTMDVEVTPRWILTPDFTLHLNNRLAYAYDLSDGSSSDAVFANLPSSNFTVFGAKTGRQAALVTVGADVLFDGGFRLTTHLDSAFSQHSQSFTGFAGVGYTW